MEIPHQVNFPEFQRPPRSSSHDCHAGKFCQLHPNIDATINHHKVSGDIEGNYFFDRRWRTCQCHLKRTTSSVEIAAKTNYLYRYNNIQKELIPFEPWRTEDHYQRLWREEVRVSKERLLKIAQMHQLPRIRAQRWRNLRRTMSVDDMGPQRLRNDSFESPETDSDSGKGSTSEIIEEENPRMISLTNEEDLSFQLLQESKALHKYVASRGQREREQEIYEVWPTTIKVQNPSGHVSDTE